MEKTLIWLKFVRSLVARLNYINSIYQLVVSTKRNSTCLDLHQWPLKKSPSTRKNLELSEDGCFSLLERSPIWPIS
ncbi:hypothetical protein GDO81_007077 [Engystomops pustulosus]|uniref:Uncharacterized protein n=1 Tax=Engystomops pustulosus TaxID=76066 RepID=A0AAV7C5V5_ENGPU|nr:hypothetical protein GDO81_007077 [Engystomops pustulosus]